MRRLLPLAALAALLATGTGLAALADSPGIAAHHGKVVETAKAGLPTQGFMEIYNSATLPDTLTGAKCPIADSTNIVGQNGAPIEQLPVAAGAKLTLGAGGPPSATAIDAFRHRSRRRHPLQSHL